MQNVPEMELNYKVGDRIKCWSLKEAIRKEMWLASKGVMTKDVGEDTLEVISIREDE